MRRESRLAFVGMTGLLGILSGCGPLMPSQGKISNTPEEEAYLISKSEPGPECKVVGGFFGYETSCGSGWGSVPDDVQFSCIRREISKAHGNRGVIDAVIGAGWYKGRVFSCPSKPSSTTSDNRNDGAKACVPGATQACTGPGGCKGGQVCADNGAKFLACDCGPAPAPSSNASSQTR